MKRRKKRFIPVVPVLLLLLPVVLTACSQEEPAAAELAAIEAAYAESELDRTERDAEFAPQYEALVDEYWGTGAALEAKLWLMGRAVRDAGEEEQAATVTEYTDAIFERYARSPHIAKLAEMSYYYSEEQIDRYFGDLRENSPHADVRAAVIYNLAFRNKIDLTYGRVEATPENEAAVEAEFRLLLDEYGDVPLNNTTYGVMADAFLNAHSEEELAIGRKAPEIIGRTVDGEEIRLSDFLGKVTVIDFWGDW